MGKCSERQFDCLSSSPSSRLGAPNGYGQSPCQRNSPLSFPVSINRIL